MSPNIQLEAALEKHDSGDLDGAACGYEALLDGPLRGDALHLLGLVAHQRGRHELARRHIEEAIALHPETPVYRANLAEVLRALGYYEAALSAVGLALDRAPELAAAWNTRGLLLQRAGRFEAAREAFLEASRRDERAADPWNNLGNLALEQGAFEAARAAYRACLQRAPRHAPAWRHLSLVKRQIDAEDPELKQLLAFSQTATETEMSHLGFAIGKAYDDLGQYEKAFESYAEGNAGLAAASGLEVDWAAMVRDWRHRLVMPFASGSPGSESALPVLIVGPPRSGTTLLEQRLLQHPSMGTAGESEALPEICSQLGDRTPDGAQRFRLAEGYLDALRAAGGPARLRIIDKNPYNLEHLRQLAWLTPHARVILMDRDLRDVGLSIYRQRFSRPTPWAHRLEDIGQWLRLRQGFTRALLAKAPLRVFVMRYAALVSQPEIELRRLCAWLELPWDPALLGDGEAAGPSRTASAWQARQPIHSRGVGRWQRYAFALDPLLEALAPPAPPAPHAAKRQS